MDRTFLQNIVFGSFSDEDNVRFFNKEGKLKSCSAALFMWDLKDVYDSQDLEGYQYGTYCSPVNDIQLSNASIFNAEQDKFADEEIIGQSNEIVNSNDNDHETDDIQNVSKTDESENTSQEPTGHNNVTFASILKKNLRPEADKKQPAAIQKQPSEDSHLQNGTNVFTTKPNSDISILGKFFQNTSLDYKFIPFKPRGLKNKSSFCYINSTLQSLLVCSAIHRVLRKIGTYPVLNQFSCNSQTPAINGMAAFVSQFDTLERQEYEQTFGKQLKAGKEVKFSDSFEPQCIYDMLNILRPSMAQDERQEDAEEFLGCVLDSMHEEMVSTVSQDDAAVRDKASQDNDQDDTESDGAEWQQALSGRKSAVTRTISRTPTLITEIFGGEIRSSVKYPTGKLSNTSQPFFTLQLDIHSDDVRHITDAIRKSMASEQVEHFITTENGEKKKVEATKKTSFEYLPSILILHLKRFVFDRGICKKLTKNIDYDLQLKIDKGLVSRECKRKDEKYRSYQLISVVFHHGLHAAGGHYTCDAYHASFGRWIRHDDTIAKIVSENEVLKVKDRSAYLLFYQRMDLSNPNN